MPVYTALAAFLGVAIALASCGPARMADRPSAGLAASEVAPRTVVPKRLTAATIGDPPTLYQVLNPAGSRGGSEALQDLMHAGLSILDRKGSLIPQLATAVPSLENGLWSVLPDGRMLTTWTIRPRVTWHDGAPFTAEDLTFTLAVGRDPDLPEFRDGAYASIEAVEAVDPQTIRVTWRRTYIGADGLFTRSLAAPLPRHLLAPPYADAKATFSQLTYFSGEYVGAGPYRLREWVRGSRLTLSAYEEYALGRPKIDQIEIRVIPDGNTLMANILAGELDATLGKTLSLEQAVEVQRQWRAGRMEVSQANPLQIHPQFLDPDPPLIGDVRFRRALYQAVDRQQLVDTLLAGRSMVAESWLSPNDPPEYWPIESSIVRYAFDPAQSARLIEGLGYTKGSDGQLRDARGQRLAVELRTVAVDINEKVILAVANDWQRVGLGVEPHIVPPQRITEMPYRAVFPGFELTRGAGDLGNLGWIHSRGARTAENNYRASGGTNYPRYMSAALDALIEEFWVTIPIDARVKVGGQIIQHMTDQVVEMSLFYDTEPTLIANRVRNLTARQLRSSNAWNALEWDVE